MFYICLQPTLNLSLQPDNKQVDRSQRVELGFFKVDRDPGKKRLFSRFYLLHDLKNFKHILSIGLNIECKQYLQNAVHCLAQFTASLM